MSSIVNGGFVSANNRLCCAFVLRQSISNTISGEPSVPCKDKAHRGTSLLDGEDASGACNDEANQDRSARGRYFHKRT